MQEMATSKLDSSGETQDVRPHLLKEHHMWQLIDLHFQSRLLTQHQIDSYNKFIHDISEVIARYGIFEVRVLPQFEINEDVLPESIWSFKFKTPISRMPPYHVNADKSTQKVTPMVCRLRGLTYECHIKCDLEYENYSLSDSDERTLIKSGVAKEVPIAKVPVMIGSDWCCLAKANKADKFANGECQFDQGGYFIVRGSEKVIVAQEKAAANFIYVYKCKSESQPWMAEIRSVPPIIASLPVLFRLIIKIEKGCPRVLCQIKTISKNLPLGIVLRALGLTSDQQIFQYICDGDFKTFSNGSPNLKAFTEVLRSSLEQVAFADQIDCLQCMGKYVHNEYAKTEDVFIEQAKFTLKERLLPHVGLDEASFRKKAVYICYMVRKLITAYVGLAEEDDRDHIGRKRVETAGDLMLSLFTTEFKSYINEAKKILLRKLTQRNSDFDQARQIIFDDRKITNTIRHSLSTGQWGKNSSGDPIRSGVSQVLKRDTTYFATLSHLRRIAYPINTSSRIIKVRLLHNTQFGYICPAETPEGEKIGVVKNLALLTKVSIEPTQPELDKLFSAIKSSKHAEVYDINVNAGQKDLSKVVLNGNFIAFSRAPAKFACQLRKLRRSGYLNECISISLDITTSEVRIMTDRGRLLRPLLIVENKTVLLNPSHLTGHPTFKGLIDKGLIEYLDVQEEENALIAMDFTMVSGKLNYTHCQIHPSMMFGVCASPIPFANHNQATKNTLQSAMSKQSMGIVATNANMRFQTTQHFHYYPQRALSMTKSSKYLKLHEMPNGANPIAAMACFTGYNQEDSIIINRSSIQRGLFRSVFFRTYQAAEHLHSLDKIQTQIKYPQQNNNKFDMSKIGIDGIALSGSHIDGEQPLIWKIHTTSELNSMNSMEPRKKVNAPLFSRRGEYGTVDRILVSENSQGNKLVKVRLRSIRIPQVGDKFASRHGQKGTCGMTFRQEDFPFTLEGIVPDMVVNPHCIPSRMTVGHLIQCLTSKVAAIKGHFSEDATSFSNFNMMKKGEQLHKAGYHRYGNQQMQNPFTGKSYESLVFIGPIYYQRLRHLVDDKMYSRSRGVVVALTRQPTHGRRRSGGLRFGEMERDCVISHGMSELLRERLFTVSDRFRIHVCNMCGLLAIAQSEQGKYFCRNCKNSAQIVQSEIPYAAKLLMQELMAMHIVPRLQFNQKKHQI